MITAKIVGGRELTAKFRQLEKVVQSRMLENALVAGALIVCNEWKRQAPVRTGQYRRSIHVGGHTELSHDFEGTDIGTQHSEPGHAQVVVGTNITDPPYPIFLEEGTSRMAARPSAGPALKAKKKEAVKEVGDALADQLRRLT